MNRVWQLPVHREPTLLEFQIRDFLKQAQRCVQRVFKSIFGSNETFAYWWDHPHRRPVFVLSIILGVITIWLTISHIATRRALKAHAASQEDIKTNVQAPSTHKSTANTRSPPETPQRRRASQAFPDKEMGMSPSAIGTRVSFGDNKTVNGRTGRVSTPDQTPFVNNTGRRNFSALAKTAPVSYNTLQQHGLLDAVGTPTRNFSQSVNMESGAANDDEEYMQVFDSPTRSYGWVERSKIAPKDIQRQAEGV